jgi:hypothetical protein
MLLYRDFVYFIKFKQEKLPEWDGMDWIDMAQDRDKWRALVNMVLNFRFP